MEIILSNHIVEKIKESEKLLAKHLFLENYTTCAFYRDEITRLKKKLD
jgi:protein-arginine kinase activator protein McsA